MQAGATRQSLSQTRTKCVLNSAAFWLTDMLGCQAEILKLQIAICNCNLSRLDNRKRLKIKRSTSQVLHLIHVYAKFKNTSPCMAYTQSQMFDHEVSEAAILAMVS